MERYTTSVPLGSTATRTRRASPGRVCGVGGCQTVLSSYNTATTCYVHTEARVTLSAARRARTSAKEPPRRFLTDEEMHMLRSA